MDHNEELIEQAVNGDKMALEQIIINIKDYIYNLSLRMLWNPMDAEDVTQEILIKVITNLAKFRQESKFSTWVYSIASHHLINTKKRFMEQQELSFEIFEAGIKEGYLPKTPVAVNEADREILAEELKISCTQAMLLCLDRESRLIYILSNIFAINSIDGANILDISPDTFRKRLSRAREKMRNFMENNCGLVNDNKTCNCNRRVEIAIENRRINPKQLIFANQPTDKKVAEVCKEEVEQFDKVAGVFRSNPFYLTPQKITESVKNLFNSGAYLIFKI